MLRNWNSASAAKTRICRSILKRSFSQGRTSKDTGKRILVSLIPGDGIGPEISLAVQKIFSKAGVPIDWESIDIRPTKDNQGRPTIPAHAMESFGKTKVGLKGPLETPVGKGHVSLNLLLRKTFNLYANLRPSKSIVGFPTKFEGVDNVIVRENTEGEYSGIEHEIQPGLCSSVKLITKTASCRVSDFAFNYARSMGRNSVVVVHKCSVMKATDGLFLECAKAVSQNFPDIQFSDLSLDEACVQMVQEPKLFKDVVLLMPNLYGDILSDLSSGLIGGLGLTASGNIGEKGAIFEAVHGTAPDIAGKDMANPTALLLSACMMLNHLNLKDFAQKIESAVLKTISEGKVLTRDLKGKASTSEFTEAICKHLSH